VGLETSNLVDRLIIASASPQVTNHPWKGRGQVTCTIKIFGALTISLELLKLEW